MPSLCRCCKRCWTTSTGNSATNWSWTTSQFPRHRIDRCATSSPRTTCTCPPSTSLICALTSARRPVQRTWLARTPRGQVLWVAGGSVDRPRLRTAISCVLEMHSPIVDSRIIRWWLPRSGLHRPVHHPRVAPQAVVCPYDGTRALAHRRDATRRWICHRPLWVNSEFACFQFLFNFFHYNSP